MSQGQQRAGAADTAPATYGCCPSPPPWAALAAASDVAGPGLRVR